MSKTFKVVFEMEVNAIDPVDAAKQVDDLIKQGEYKWQFYIQRRMPPEQPRKPIYSVDFESDPPEVEKLIEYSPLIR